MPAIVLLSIWSFVTENDGRNCIVAFARTHSRPKENTLAASAGGGSFDETKNQRSGSFGDVRCLGAFLPLHNLNLHCIAFLQALVALGSDRAVMDKDVRATLSSEEPVSFRIVKPLDGAFQTFHVPPSFLASPGTVEIPRDGPAKNV